MRLRIYDPRILAIDLRHRRFGYAVFEGHRLMLDWGVRIYRALGDVEAEMARRRLDALLRLYTPSVIVVKKERWDRALTNLHMRTLVESISREAFGQSIPIVIISDDDVRKTFQNLGCETRDEIAAALTRIFPELLWQLPLKRMAWQSEHPRMTMFDAIALGMAYWQHSGTQHPPPPA